MISPPGHNSSYNLFGRECIQAVKAAHLSVHVGYGGLDHRRFVDQKFVEQSNLLDRFQMAFTYVA